MFVDNVVLAGVVTVGLMVAFLRRLSDISSGSDAHKKR